jgi:hypothetical protein
MASMPPTLVYHGDVYLCHAAPRDDAAIWLDYVDAEGDVRPSPIETIEAEASGIDASLILCGHTHIPRVVRLRDGRMIVNPGSVGLPGYDGQTQVPYKVESERRTLATPFWSGRALVGRPLYDTFHTTVRLQRRWRGAEVGRYGPARSRQAGSIARRRSVVGTREKVWALQELRQLSEGIAVVATMRPSRGKLTPTRTQGALSAVDLSASITFGVSYGPTATSTAR